MSPATLTLQLPEALAQELDALDQELLLDVVERGVRSIRIERALIRYGEGGISFSAAAELANVSPAELARHAYARGIEPPFSEQALAEELQ